MLAGRVALQGAAEGTIGVLGLDDHAQRAAGVRGELDADLDTTRRLMDNDPGVRAGIFSIELHPVRGFPGSCLP